MKQRPGVRLRTILREQIVSGHYPVGEYIPSVRQLVDEYNVARATANSALKTLQHEGLLLLEPRRGYRVKPGACDPDRGCPVGFVDRVTSGSAQWNGGEQEYISALRVGVAKYGWPLLSIGAEGQSPEDVMRQLLAARTCGVIVSGLREVADQARQAGLPCVAMDWWEEDLGLDAVLQDDFQGGRLAARHLLSRGHKKIAWLGQTTDSYHSMARLGGAMTELARGGVGLPPELCVSCGGPNAAEAAHTLLARPDRPRAFLALWSGVANGLLKAAEALGLRPGPDFEMVGWAREEEYRRDYVPAFAGGVVQPAITWSPLKMAEVAVERIAARRKHPNLAVVKINIPVCLQCEGATE